MAIPGNFGQRKGRKRRVRQKTKGRTQIPCATRGFDEIQEDLVFLALKHGLPEGHEVKTGMILTPKIKVKNGPTKTVFLTFVETKTGKEWQQTFDYQKIEDALIGGEELKAVKDE